MSFDPSKKEYWTPYKDDTVSYARSRLVSGRDRSGIRYRKVLFQTSLWMLKIAFGVGIAVSMWNSASTFWK